MDMLYADFANDPKSLATHESSDAEALERLRNLKQGLYADRTFEPEQFIRIAKSTHLFNGRTDLVERFAKGEID